MKTFFPFMHELADAAGRVVIPFYRTALLPDNKADEGASFDPVTAADKASEEAMRRLIKARYPEHGIIGEEYGNDRPDAEYVWVLDPIDGTRAFLSGMPTWGILVGLMHRGKAAAGMIDQPYLRERFWGDGMTAWASGFRGERRLQTRNAASLADAIVWVSSTFTNDPARQAIVEALRPHVRILRYGSDCFSMAMLADGNIDIVIETGLEIYDIAATVPVVTGAGGIISGLDGRDAVDSASIIAASSPTLHEAARAIIDGR